MQQLKKQIVSFIDTELHSAWLWIVGISLLPLDESCLSKKKSGSACLSSLVFFAQTHH